MHLVTEIAFIVTGVVVPVEGIPIPLLWQILLWFKRGLRGDDWPLSTQTKLQERFVECKTYTRHDVEDDRRQRAEGLAFFIKLIIRFT